MEFGLIFVIIPYTMYFRLIFVLMLYTMDFCLIFHLRFSIPDINNTNDRDILYKEC